jgi:hypothetical protein
VWRAGERRGWEDAQEVVEDDERVSIRDRVCVVGKLGERHAGKVIQTHTFLATCELA